MSSADPAGAKQEALKAAVAEQMAARVLAAERQQGVPMARHHHQYPRHNLYIILLVALAAVGSLVALVLRG